MPPALDQQAFIEAIGMMIAMIAQACAMVSQGGSNDLQRLEAHHPLIFRGGGDYMVRITMAIDLFSNSRDSVKISSLGVIRRPLPLKS